MKIIFAGTPDFAVPCLQALIDGPHEVVAVYTQPDRPAGRGRKLTSSPVKLRALAHDIPVHQPVSLKDSGEQAALRALEPELMVVAAYGLLLPAAVLAMPRLGCVNVHASLLPRWRGAAPIQRAIAAGDTQTGVTLMRMDEGLDTGPVLLQSRCPIEPDDTGGSLHDKLAAMGASLLAQGVEQLAANKLQATAQPEEGVTYAHKLTKGEARIDWTGSAQDIALQVRAYNPWPVAHGELDGKPVRVWRAAAQDTHTDAEPGAILSATDEGIDVKCGEGALKILELQWPGGRPMNAAQACHGHELTGRQFR